MEYTQTWASMEGMVEAGKCKAIGVSNFTQEQLEHLTSVAKIPPTVNQVELHPYFQQSELMAYCESAGIVMMGYSPMGSSFDRFPDGHGTTLLKHPLVNEIAEAAGKTASQVLIRFGLQKYPTNLVSIPKSSNAERIGQNFGVTDWELSDEAMTSLSGLESDFRYFISYLKKPDNDVKWHFGKVEAGDNSDWVGTPPSA